MKTIIYYILFILFYSVLSATTAMFFMSWGAKRNPLEAAYVFFIGKPFDWSISLWFLPLNGLVWATLFYLMIVFYKRVFQKK